MSLFLRYRSGYAQLKSLYSQSLVVDIESKCSLFFRICIARLTTALRYGVREQLSQPPWLYGSDKVATRDCRSSRPSLLHHAMNRDANFEAAQRDRWFNNLDRASSRNSNNKFEQNEKLLFNSDWDVGHAFAINLGGKKPRIRSWQNKADHSCKLWGKARQQTK